jgi:hypothetical protein
MFAAAQAAQDWIEKGAYGVIALSRDPWENWPDLNLKWLVKKTAEGTTGEAGFGDTLGTWRHE